MLVSQQRLGDVSKDMPLALLTRTILRQVETTQHHILAGSNRWFTSSWSKQVARREHQLAGLVLRFIRERYVHCHLVAVKVCVEG